MATVGNASGEVREDIPLKQGVKTSRVWSCDEDCFGGPKFISFAFAVLTAVITVALLVQIYYGDYQVVPHGSVATDSKECSTIGTSILKAGGNAADAAVASAFCLAVVNPHNTGLDAGGQLMIYNHVTRVDPNVIDFSNMNVEVSELPRLVLGLAHVHQQYCKLPWKQLVEPASQLAREGFLVSHVLAAAIQSVFMAAKLFGPLEAGQRIAMVRLGKFLQTIADIPENDLYKHITLQHQPTVSQATKSTFKYYNIYVPDTTAIGPAFLATLKQIEYLNFTAEDTTTPRYVYQLADITKTIYVDQNIAKQFYQGTSSNIAVMDLNDLYVSLVTGMHSPFGALDLTTGGFLLDNTTSQLAPSRIPIIITDSDFVCGRRIVMGISDISVGSQVIPSLLIGDENATASIEAPRFYINGDIIGVEGGRAALFSAEVKKQLWKLGSVVLMHEPYNSCNIVEKIADDLNSHSDSRGGGISSRF